jgi:ureidoglycolate lyase
MPPLSATPLTIEAYREYGDLISARDDIAAVSCNGDTARKFNFAADLQNLRAQKAKPNFSFFRCKPQVESGQRQFEIRLLERHSFSTQVFIPMSGTERFLIVVARGGDRPDLSTLRAFVVSGQQGISYRPGIWHHPLVAMDKPSSFACLVWEDGTASDCEVLDLSPPLTIQLPKR